MKKIITILLGLILMCSFVFAEPQGIHEPGAGLEQPELREEAQGTGQGLTQNATEGERAAAETGQQIAAELRRELRMQTAEGVQQLIQERKQEMEQEVQGLQNAARQKAYQNQNQIRLAVHSLLDMEELVGGIGKEVSQIARNFNNSIQATLRAEERIEARSGFKRFFVGGDEAAAEEIEQEVNQNRERIEELQRLRDECDCDVEARAMMQEQIESMEQEQERLQGLAQNEKQSKGIFGWLWK